MHFSDDTLDTTFDDTLKRTLLARGYTCIETHLSRVYLRGDDVFKTKRRVRFSFVDFSTDAVRRSACDAEVTLNSRLAPDVYRGVVAFGLDAQGEPHVHAPEAVPEGLSHSWAVHMRRLPEDARADVQLARGQLGAPEIVEIALMLADFHAQCRSDEETARCGAEHVLRGNVEENFRELALLFDHYLSRDDQTRLMHAQRNILLRRSGLLARRTREGRVRDGHGDLRLEHIYRDDAGRYFAIDCIEFSDRFRFGDVVLDLAFLAMDLHLHGRPELAELLLAEYARASFDYALYGIVDFYISYRAVVRAKVSAFLAADQAVSEDTQARAAREAKRAFALSLTSLDAPAEGPVLIVCCGLMASGKSTLAKRLGRELAAPVVSADRERKHLLGADPLSAHHEAPFRGSYSDAITEQVYEALRDHARVVLASGRTVVLDATYRARSERDDVRELAAELGVPIVFIECVVSRELAMARLHERVAGASESDGRPAIFDAVSRTFQPLTELEPDAHLRLDTSETLEANVARCVARFNTLRAQSPRPRAGK